MVSIEADGGGINAFHEYFRSSGPLYKGREPSSVTQAVLDEFGIGPTQIIDLVLTGSPEGNIAANKEVIDAIEENKAYWFRGTNIIGMFRGDKSLYRPLLPENDGDAFATRDAAAILGQNPDAIIFVSDNRVIDTANPEGQPELTLPSVDIYAHAAAGTLTTALTAPVYWYEAVFDYGKMIFTPVLHRSPESLTGAENPWWAPTVAGMQGDATSTTNVGGFDPTRPNSPHFDFVADAYAIGPNCGYCETGNYAPYADGNAPSKSGPALVAAGAASKMILRARQLASYSGGIRLVGGKPVMVQAGNQVWTTWDMRRALEVAAVTPRFNLNTSDPTRSQLTVLDQAPWLTTGWGELTGDPDAGVAEAAVTFLGLTSTPKAAEKPTAFCDFQTTYITAKRLYWDNSIFSPTFGITNDPYRYCGS